MSKIKFNVDGNLRNKNPWIIRHKHKEYRKKELARLKGEKQDMPDDLSGIYGMPDIRAKQETPAGFYEFCKYLKITNPRSTPQVIPLRLYDFQRNFISAIHNRNFVLAKKFRQGGFTTLGLAYLAWQGVFHNKRSVVVSGYDRYAMSLCYMVERMLDEVPSYMLSHTKVRSHSIEFPGGGEIYFKNTQPCIGKQTDFVMLDEPAFWPDADKVFKAMWPTIATGGKFFAVSTPNKQEGWFYESWIDVNANFYKFEVPYTEHPQFHDKEWVETIKANLGEKGWRQEFLAEFLPLERE
jgi:hypothetical protein